MAKTLNKLDQQKVYMLGKFLREQKAEIENKRFGLRKTAEFASERLPFPVTQRNIKTICQSMGDDAPKLASIARTGNITESAVSAGLTRLRKAVRFIAENLKDLNPEIQSGVQAILSGQPLEEKSEESD